jgi:catechol 2,3-dioxygenase-like lactoylglutathione lyase family enzyme
VTVSIRRLLETALYCDDVPRTAAFYEQLLGRAPMLESDRLVAFDAGEATVLLIFHRGHAHPLPTIGGLVPGHDGAGPVHIAFAIDRSDLAPWESRLESLRIAIESRVTWDSGGVSLYFRDPDGRSVELATPGLWPTY